MHQKDFSIIERSNVQSDVIVVNQCDKDLIEEFDFINIKGIKCHAKFIHTTERGLSRSRNLAIQNSWGELCYICDDDVLLDDDFEGKVTRAYGSNPRYDLITFALDRKNYTYPNHSTRMGIREILKTSSVQITFRRSVILKNNLQFDPKMGSGSGNGGGEENKFLMDCKRKGLGMHYIPEVIATVKSEDSLWFHGFDEKYFNDTFWAARRSIGSVLAFCYVIYWCLLRSRKYNISLSKWQILKYSFAGYFDKR